ncbi:hypothetical protein FDP41_008255 [Naegleria fowleri]|uniref:Uncharacterized protein n=1 Tax=Naegleria fowleri TaxID=5763 RepID=A0A6A5BGF2_NAEFO|nr:uncharacterized protein FDP41_008255 [Naegleria fowleri]KAF0973551.1 hypothetical protein FDP41_008255 [Naegleria fowleri]CAG4709928.1 unnamed protein product [Naegleria fowleri]
MDENIRIKENEFAVNVQFPLFASSSHSSRKNKNVATPSSHRHLLSFSPSQGRFQSSEEAIPAKTFLSTALDVQDAQEASKRVQSSSSQQPNDTSSQTNCLFAIKELKSLSQIVAMQCVIGELVILFEDWESCERKESKDQNPSLLLYHIHGFSNVRSINERTSLIHKIALPKISTFQKAHPACDEQEHEIIEQGRELTRDDIIHFNFHCDYGKRVYFLHLRNGKLLVRGSNVFNELGLTERKDFIDHWTNIHLCDHGDYITSIKTNTHNTVFGTQNGKWILCGRDAYLVYNRIVNVDSVTWDSLNAELLDPPYILDISIEGECILKMEQLFAGTIILTKSGNIYSTIRDRLNIFTELINDTTSPTCLMVTQLSHNPEKSGEIVKSSIARECYKIDLPFAVSDVIAVDNAMLLKRKEDSQLFLLKRSQLFDLEISNVKKIICSTDEFFVISKNNSLYSIYSGATFPSLKPIELPRELKHYVPNNKQSKQIKLANMASTNPRQKKKEEIPEETEPTHNLWENCASLDIRTVISMTPNFSIIVVEEGHNELESHFVNSLTGQTSSLLYDIEICFSHSTQH